MIRVLLVDDHAAFRQPLAFMLNREPDVTVVGQAGTIGEARTLLQDADVAVIDLDLPDGNGIDLIREFRMTNRQGRVLVLTGSGVREEQALAIEAGAAGVMHKSIAFPAIIEAVQHLGAGAELMSPAETLELLRLANRHRERNREAQLALGRLTPREGEVLQSLAEGLSDKEIAERLHISAQTVRTHMVNILSKLEVTRRAEAAAYLARHTGTPGDQP